MLCASCMLRVRASSATLSFSLTDIGFNCTNTHTHIYSVHVYISKGAVPETPLPARPLSQSYRLPVQSAARQPPLAMVEAHTSSAQLRTPAFLTPAFLTPAGGRVLGGTTTSTTTTSLFHQTRQQFTCPRATRKPPVRWRAVASDLSERAEYLLRVRSSLVNRCVGADDAFWEAMQSEARIAAEEEPLLASFLFSTVLNHRTLKSALAFHLANKLSSSAMPSTMLMRLFTDAMTNTPLFCQTLREDLLAVMERDPACTRLIDALLYFKGFHALQAHRVAHELWKAGRVPLAYHLQSQVSKELQVDIHPAATIGPGAFFDHATGVVIGETAVIGKNVSMLHHVTLGGSGKQHGDRHPKIGDGVLIGAGATILGNVHVGHGVQIGACSLVLEDIPAHATVVGVPARVVSRQRVTVPALHMKHEYCLECLKGIEHTDHSYHESLPALVAKSGNLEAMQ